MSSPTIAIERAIEVAEHNGWYAPDGALIVFDALTNDPATGIRLELGVNARACGGYWAMCRDGVGRSVVLSGGPDVTREEILTAALDRYLSILNNGI